MSHTNSPRNSTQLAYRPDIEGLRAVAVLLVIFSHAGFSWLEGGFIGVDVFFVISGFLITGILQKELDITGKIDFFSFYARRFRRLLPALAVMVLGSCLLASHFLPPTDIPEQASAAAAAIFWISNIFFAFKEFDYFGNSANDNLFLHTWSLGVEEQFYLIWPATLLLLAHLKSLKVIKEQHLKIILSIIGLVSFFSCAYLTYRHPNSAYYLMPLRFWQFTAGALAFYLFSHVQLRTGKTEYSLARSFGLATILASAALINSNVSYPGFLALAPTIGTFLLLAFGNSAQSKTNIGSKTPLAIRWLTTRPMSAMGKISYSWYLWHWPILIIGDIFFQSNSVLITLLLIGLSWVLAVASYHAIEIPFRKNLLAPTRTGWQIGAAAVAMILINTQIFQWNISSYNRASLATESLYSTAVSDLPSIYSEGCDDWYHSATLNPCAFGSRSGQKKLILIGDSVALQWFPALNQIFESWQITVLTKSSCPMVNAPYFYPRINRRFTECEEWRDKALGYIAEKQPDLVIFGSAETYDYSFNEWKKGTEDIIDKILKDSKKIALIRPTPRLPFNFLKCLENKENPDDCSTPYSPDQSVAWSAITKIKPNSKIYFLDFNNAVCPNNYCKALSNGVATYRDRVHLTSSFVQSLIPDIKLEARKLLPTEQ